MEKGIPEVDVLLPERDIQAKQMGVISIQCLAGSRSTSHRDSCQHILDRITGHEAWDHPINGRRQKEGRRIKNDLSTKITLHFPSSSKIGGLRNALPPEF